MTLDHNTSAKKTIFFENLDGLRAIAALAVIFYHMSLWYAFPNEKIYSYIKKLFSFGRVGGSLGVTFFFILSGFLITFLLFIEQENNNKINILKFYMRRILRIWPLYYLTVLIGFLAYPKMFELSGDAYNETGNLFLYLIFGANFDPIYLQGSHNPILGVHWSVAIEEQFYLIWPLLFIFFSRTRSFLICLAAIIVLSEFFTNFVYSWPVKYYHLFSNIKYLAFGALIAAICYNKKELIIKQISRIPKTLNITIYFICLVLLFNRTQINIILPNHKFIFNILAMSFFGYVLIDQNFSTNSLFKIGKIKSLSWLGKISYGLYLNHMIAISIIISIFPKDETYLFTKFLLTIIITIVMSHLSHKYYESFFISLKNKFSS
jgi:peptidoglycan/LPS O-acetylase OafA/YrhL